MDEIEDKPTMLTVALDIRKELEEYKKSNNRSALVEALKTQFLANRHIAASKSEEARTLALSILVQRLPDMSENMLLRVVEVLAKVGDIDLQSLMGIFPGKGPAFQLNQMFGSTNTESTSARSEGSQSNPAKASGLLLEALEHLSSHLKSKTVEAKVEEEK